MRILNVTESYAPFDEFGGPPVKVRALSEGLASRGHEVTVLTADWGLERRLKKLPEAAPPERSPFGWRRKDAGVSAIYLPTWLHYRAVSWNPAVSRFCRARLQNFDVVHIFGLYDLLGPAVGAFCRKFGIPYVVEPIGMFVPIVRSLILKRFYHAFYGKRLFEGAAATVATSEQELETFVAGGMVREKIVMRRNGVMAPKKLPERGTFRVANGIPADARVVLFLGRLSSKKSPDLLLEAFAALTEGIRESDLWLVFAGPDETGMRARLEQLAAKRNVANRVRFTGPALGEEKWGAYRDADLFVLPSLNENFGNTAAEAAATGTPVIVSERCGIAPLLSGGASIVVPHDKGALCAAMRQVLEDRELSRELSRQGIIAATRLGWREPVGEMDILYTKLAGSVLRGRQSQMVPADLVGQ
jgi:glycosyltransferase involved in cell wall biosynthesis